MNMSFRMKMIILCFTVWLVPFTVYGQDSSQGVFSGKNAYTHVQYLSEKVGPRPAGSEGEKKAAEYLYYMLEKYGWQVKVQPFSKIVSQDNPLYPENKIQVISSQNIIAELPGKRPESVLLGAHYDTADYSVPGALDNASGVGTLLEIARILGQSEHEDTYQIVFFGAEEYGLVGSSYYASQTDLSALRWMLNLDMVGTPLEVDIAGKVSAPPEMVKQVANVISGEGIPFHVSREFAVMTREGSQGGSSDFSSFLDQGIPAIGLGIEGRPGGFYHRPEDKIEQVSLSDLEKVGNLIPVILKDLEVKETGFRTWDPYYLTFQIGAKVLVLPTLALRLFCILVIFLTGFTAYTLLRGKQSEKRESFTNYLVAGIALPVALVMALALSGMGEYLWQYLKGCNILWFAHPEIFSLLRVSLLISFMIIAGSILTKLPMPKSTKFYWSIGATLLTLGSILLSLYRIDMAFTFLFWLFCYNLMYLCPTIALKIILAITGPFFVYTFHWELLNSPQWISFYDTIHQYPQVFIILYALLLLPFFVAGIFIVKLLPGSLKKYMKRLWVPLFAMTIVFILGTGVVPNYTREFPQVVTVNKEWLDHQKANVSIASNDYLPKSLTQELNQAPGKMIKIEAPYEKPPMDSRISVMQTENLKNILMSFDFVRDPYLVRMKFDSKDPYSITQIDDFLPISKLPRKIKLEGMEQKGNYILTLERTPPHKKQVQLEIKAQGTLKCTLEVYFSDKDPSLRLEHQTLSPTYEEKYATIFEF